MCDQNLHDYLESYRKNVGMEGGLGGQGDGGGGEKERGLNRGRVREGVAWTTAEGIERGREKEMVIGLDGEQREERIDNAQEGRKESIKETKKEKK